MGVQMIFTQLHRKRERDTVRFVSVCTCVCVQTVRVRVKFVQRQAARGEITEQLAWRCADRGGDVSVGKDVCPTALIVVYKVTRSSKETAGEGKMIWMKMKTRPREMVWAEGKRTLPVLPQ